MFERDAAKKIYFENFSKSRRKKKEEYYPKLEIKIISNRTKFFLLYRDKRNLIRKIYLKYNSAPSIDIWTRMSASKVGLVAPTTKMTHGGLRNACMAVLRLPSARGTRLHAH